jgi:hypothetical protein
MRLEDGLEVHKFVKVFGPLADPSDRVVLRLCLRPFYGLYRRFESRRRHGCVVSCVCCLGGGLCDGLITGSEESYWLCDLGTSKRSGLGSSEAVASCPLHNIHKCNLVQGSLSLTLLSQL